ncbi:hypothetical protein LCGC14_0359080 [marine sediment metagenome]|uniref:Peptidase M15A C-terminal domain-containing protein n=1 Tax=marine sediment metagenome TaxID=412755 RepID=A0A0F9WGK6_9ZZZZ|nr:hypothetical protein [Candidatus Aminicenantes bacterium]
MVWYKQGVYGDLQIPARKALGKVARLYASKKQDLFITAIRDGNHGFGSLHYDGLAFDFRKGKGISKLDIQDMLGLDYDVVEHEGHYHVEYDPKGRGY